MHKDVWKYLFIFLLTGSISACKKDLDEYGPTVNFITPVESQSFNVNNDVLVNATVQDDRKITSVSVGLLNADYQSVHTSISVPVSSPSMNVNLYYTLNNIHLETGYYYIEIFASDGTNDTRKQQKIFITAVPKVVSAICLVSASTVLQTNLSYIDTGFSSITPVFSFSGDYIGSGVSSYHQQAYTAGNHTGALNALKLESNSIKYSITHPVSADPYYMSLYNNEQNTYVALYDGYVRGYDHNGALVYSASSNSGFYPLKFCFNSDRLITEQKATSGGARILVSYYAGGSPQQQVSMNQDVVAFCEKDEENVFVFGNVSGQAVIQLYDRLANNLWSPYPGALPTGALLSAVKLSENTYLLGHSNGTIYRYDYTSSSLTTWLAGHTAIQLKYDPLQNEVYVVEANSVSTFDFISLAPHNSIASAENILDIHILYNR